MERSTISAKLTKKLLLIYALNVADWICTVILLHTERFCEANPLMRPFLTNIPSGFLLKCLFPAAAILAIRFTLRQLDPDELRIADRFIAFALVFYAAIGVDHIINCLLLMFQAV